MNWEAEILRESSPPTMCHMSRVTCHVSRVMCQVSRIRCQVYLFILQCGGASRGKVCYQRGLPRPSRPAVSAPCTEWAQHLPQVASLTSIL